MELLRASPYPQEWIRIEGRRHPNLAPFAEDSLGEGASARLGPFRFGVAELEPRKNTEKK